jgi:hypothetical protein
MGIGKIAEGDYTKYQGAENRNVFELLSVKRRVKEIREEEELYDKKSVINSRLVCERKNPFREQGEYTIKKYYP